MTFSGLGARVRLGAGLAGAPGFEGCEGFEPGLALPRECGRAEPLAEL